MTGYVWIALDAVLAIHEQQLAEHGGSPGIRDVGLLHSALARPRNVAAYGRPDIAEVAAAYVHALAANRPFVDGNQRVSAVVTELFLDLNGHALLVDDAELAATWMRLAGGELSQAEMATWLRAGIVRIDSD